MFNHSFRRMSETQWKTVDDLVNRLVVPTDPALDEALTRSAHAGLPPIQVSRAQGRLLYVLARSVGARRILEIGTLGAYSTIWLARALPPTGRLVTLEANPEHAKVARGNLARAGLDTLVDLRLGPAITTLPQLAAEHAGPFDFTFIDADKPSTAEYFDWAVRLSRAGSLIVVDNVVRQGAVAEARSSDPNVQGMRRFLTRLGAEPRVVGSVVQTVGEKGYDGFALALVTKTE
jgi:predicted O-methyltransferase YrrM